MPGFNVQGISPSLKDAMPFRSYRWRLVTLGEQTFKEELKYVKSITLPQYTMTKLEEVSPSGLTYKYASGISWNDVSVTFYDTIGIYNKIKEWSDTIWNENTGLQPASEYKKDSLFELTDNNGDTKQTFKLKNSWPASVNHSALSYDSNDMKTIEVTLSYDWSEFFSS